MTTWQASPGKTFLRPSGPTGLHLFVVLLGPAVVQNYGQSPQLLLASVCSIKSGLPYDDACELHPGDHAFIQHPSYVAYRYMCIEQVAHVSDMIDKGVWREHTPVAADVLRRMTGGVCASRLTPRMYKSLFGCP